MTAPRVYIAGPDVFRPDAAKIGEGCKAHCWTLGMEAVWPADGDSDHEMLAPTAVAQAIYLTNLELIRTSAAVIANISPFRGPHMDCGTAFEIGHAIALGKPVFAWTHASSTSRPRNLIERMWSAPGADLSPRDGFGNLVEHFGLPENLMIACGVRSIETSFIAAAAACARHLGATPR